MRMFFSRIRVSLWWVFTRMAGMGGISRFRVKPQEEKQVAGSREVANMHARLSYANVFLAYSRVALVGVHANGANVGHFAISRETPGAWHTAQSKAQDQRSLVPLR